MSINSINTHSTAAVQQTYSVQQSSSSATNVSSLQSESLQDDTVSLSGTQTAATTESSYNPTSFGSAGILPPE